MSALTCGCDRESKWTCDRHKTELWNRPWRLRVILESPLGSPTRDGIELNKEYARNCMKDSLIRGEAPFASHLLYDHPSILNDMIPEERHWGMNAGFEWIQMAEMTVVYTDFGISRGMAEGIKQAEKHGRPIEYRSLGNERR